MSKLLAPALALSAIMATAAPAMAREVSTSDAWAWKVPTALDCPASEGGLDKVSQSPDGQWCDYRSRRGDTVRLRILPLGGRSPSEALAATRAELHTLAPVYNQPVPASYDGEEGDRADVDLPFLHVHAVGDRADVRLFGIHVSSKGDNADVKVGMGHKHSVVHAGLRGAEVTADDVGKSNATLVYVLASNKREPSGFRTVGYVAKGPIAGPMVVAEFHSPDRRHDETDGDHGDIGRLLDRNVRR